LCIPLVSFILSLALIIAYIFLPLLLSILLHYWLSGHDLLHLCLSWKVSISPSILKVTDQCSNVDYQYILIHAVLHFRVSAEKSAVILIGLTL
jgi:hypothetical protein